MLKQKTLKDSFSLSGKGLHTGLDLTVTFNPAPDNHGYKIQRTDLEGQPIIDAVADNVTETTRGTVLSKNGVKISTVEHGMAALYALGIDNCLIQVNGPEFPILDGSAQYYVNEIERVGTVEQSAVKDFYIIKSKIEFRDDATGSSIIVLPDENFSLNVLVSYDSTIIPNQFATLEDMAKFKDEVAASRTFVFVREIEPLLQAGLIKGGDLDNAIVIYEREMPQDAYFYRRALTSSWHLKWKSQHPEVLNNKGWPPDIAPQRYHCWQIPIKIASLFRYRYNPIHLENKNQINSIELRYCTKQHRPFFSPRN